jgi:hypothetical protein
MYFSEVSSAPLPRKIMLQGASSSVLLIKHQLGDQVKKTKTGRTCSMYGGEEGAYRVLVGNPQGRRPLKDSGVDGRIILK